MKISSSINVHNQGYTKGLSKHITRDYKRDSNQNIDRRYSKYNQYYNLSVDPKYVSGQSKGTYQTGNDLKFQLNKKHFNTYLKARNKKALLQHHSDRVKNLSQYLKNKHTDKQLVATMGHGMRKYLRTVVYNLYDDESPKQLNDRLLKAYSASMARYSRGFSSRNSKLLCVRWGTNVDEVKNYKDSSPHAHLDTIPMGYTKKGKPSCSINNALESEFNTNDRKVAFARFSNRESKAILTATRKTFERRFPRYKKLSKNPFAFQLSRTGSDYTGLDMNVYKATRSATDKTVARADSKVAKASLMATSYRAKASLASASYKYQPTKAQNSYRSSVASSFSALSSVNHAISSVNASNSATNKHVAKALSNSTTKLEVTRQIITNSAQHLGKSRKQFDNRMADTLEMTTPKLSNRNRGNVTTREEYKKIVQGKVSLDGKTGVNAVLASIDAYYDRKHREFREYVKSKEIEVRHKLDGWAKSEHRKMKIDLIKFKATMPTPSEISQHLKTVGNKGAHKVQSTYHSARGMVNQFFSKENHKDHQRRYRNHGHDWHL